MKVKDVLSGYPKTVIGAVFLLGASAWYLPWQLVLVLAALIWVTALCLGAHKKSFRRLLLAYAAFTLLWAAGRVGFAVFNAGWGGFAAGLMLGADLALRLALIAGAGFCLLLLLTPVRIAKEAGLIAKWVAPNSFWKLSLAILIMLSYFEAALFAWKGISQTLKLRGNTLPMQTKMAFAGAALLRLLACQTWERAFAVAGRKLDSPEAWAN